MKHLMFALAITLAACGGKKEDKAPPAPTTGSAVAMGSAGSAVETGSAGSAAATGSAGSAVAVDVPTEVDFEAKAKTDITDKNVDAQVKKIEDDLGKQ